MVEPSIAIIGVGENNKFGHPNNEILDRLKSFSIQIYRTDKDREINVNITNRGVISVRSCIKRLFS